MDGQFAIEITNPEIPENIRKVLSTGLTTYKCKLTDEYTAVTSGMNDELCLDLERTGSWLEYNLKGTMPKTYYLIALVSIREIESGWGYYKKLYPEINHRQDFWDTDAWLYGLLDYTRDHNAGTI